MTIQHLFSCPSAEGTPVLFYWPHLHIKPFAKGKREGMLSLCLSFLQASEVLRECLEGVREQGWAARDGWVRVGSCELNGRQGSPRHPV